MLCYLIYLYPTTYRFLSSNKREMHPTIQQPLRWSPMTTHNFFHKSLSNSECSLILGGKHLQPLSKIISEHNCILIIRVRFHKLNYINSYMMKVNLHWYRREWRLHCLTRWTGCTHQATLTLPGNISPHPRPPVMF